MMKPAADLGRAMKTLARRVESAAADGTVTRDEKRSINAQLDRVEGRAQGMVTHVGAKALEAVADIRNMSRQELAAQADSALSIIAVYTDQNARMIESYAALADATGDDAWNERASRAAKALLSARMHADGYVMQMAPDVDAVVAGAGDVRKRALRVEKDRPYLKPNAHFGKALVALYSSTGDGAFLDAADKIARALAVLEDTADGGGSGGSGGGAGGFFATTARPTDALTSREKPYADNVAAARFLFALAALHHDDAMRARAERTLRAVVTEAAVQELGPSALAETLLALDEMGRGVVDVSVTGDAAAGRPLLTAARAAPGAKLARLDLEGRYPKGKQSTAFVCNKHACSRPLADAAALPREIARAQRWPGACPLAAAPAK